MAIKNTEILGQPKKKELVIERVANTALYALRFKGGGELPKALKGASYTSPALAQREIDNYNAGR